jgi:hypothetical protein
MSIGAAFPPTPTISFISYGKIIFDLHFFLFTLPFSRT